MQNYPIRVFIHTMALTLIGLLGNTSTGSAQTLSFVVDQANVAAEGSLIPIGPLTNPINALIQPLVQTFRPTMTKLNVIQLYMAPDDHYATVSVSLHEGNLFTAGVTSPRVPGGTSLLATLPAGSGPQVVSFVYPAGVSLNPAKMYAIEIMLYSAKKVYVYKTPTSSYSSGSVQKTWSSIATNEDLWFQEGPSN